ncbi:MAG: helix-turn-helix transcriptional regulator [Clostridia bacterium]|nr:helix-turn-helix transcriptional regulator [Clostridia bacterium]
MNEITALTESTYYILLVLHTPRHGYGIMQEVEHLSAGRVRLAAGTLYGALTSLCDKGWIVPLPSVEDSRRKEYRLTEIGLSVLQNELSRLRQLVENGISILGEE